MLRTGRPPFDYKSRREVAANGGVLPRPNFSRPDPERAGPLHLDTVLGPVPAGLAHRVVARAEATVPDAATVLPDCLRGRNEPVVVQFEIHKPGGVVLLLPAVQKVRVAP